LVECSQEQCGDHPGSAVMARQRRSRLLKMVFNRKEDKLFNRYFLDLAGGRPSQSISVSISNLPLDLGSLEEESYQDR
jgi:hypothetical protein